MAFKPKSSGKSNSSSGEDTSKYPVPKAGARKARVSLIVDLGVQNREDFEDPKTKEVKPQKPQQQVAVFADLTHDVVDYGGKIGKAQYRLMLNKSFQNVVQGINFAAVPPRDADGNMIDGKAWGLHPANLLTKLAKAVDRSDVIVDEGEYGMDISQLLDLPFMAEVEVKETEGKKKDANDNPIIYRNVNYRGPSKLAMEEDEDGNETPVKVNELKQPARCITFEDATAEDVQFIRSNLIAMIKTANNYAGSQMQKAIEEYEGKSGSKSAPADEQEEEVEQKAKPVAKKPAAAKKPPVEFDDSDELPF